jgi:hypothetical protein
MLQYGVDLFNSFLKMSHCAQLVVFSSAIKQAHSLSQAQVQNGSSLLSAVASAQAGPRTSLHRQFSSHNGRSHLVTPSPLLPLTPPPVYTHLSLVHLPQPRLQHGDRLTPTVSSFQEGLLGCSLPNFCQFSLQSFLS